MLIFCNFLLFPHSGNLVNLDEEGLWKALLIIFIIYPLICIPPSYFLKFWQWTTVPLISPHLFAQTTPCFRIDFALQNFQTEKRQIWQILLSRGSLHFCIWIPFCPFIFSSNLFVKYKYGNIWRYLILEATTCVRLLYQHNNCKTATNSSCDKYPAKKSFLFCLHFLLGFLSVCWFVCLIVCLIFVCGSCVKGGLLWV